MHRNWEDWIGMLLGVLIGLSTWIVGGQYAPAIAWNAVLVGLLVLALSQLEYAALRRWEEVGVIACGLWLIASPYALGYADTGSLRVWHFALGAMVTLLSVFELWQDWQLTDKELARHGE
jgi:hypothetical protein